MVLHAIYYTRQATPFFDTQVWRSDTLLSPSYGMPSFTLSVYVFLGLNQ